MAVRDANPMEWSRFHYETSGDGGTAKLRVSPGMPDCLGWCAEWIPPGTLALDRTFQGVWFGPSTTADRPIIALRRYVPGGGGYEPRVLLDGVLAPVQTTASVAIRVHRDSLVADAEASSPEFDRVGDYGFTSSADMDPLFEALRRLTTDPVSTLVIHAESEASIARALAGTLVRLPRESTTGLYFSTMQFKADPTLRVVGVVKGLWDGEYPFRSVHITLPTTQSVAEPVKPTARKARGEDTRPSPKNGDPEEDGLVVCPRCGRRSGRQQAWHWAGERLGFAGLFDRRFSRRGAELKRLASLAPYDCAVCKLTFNAPDTTTVVIAGPRRSGVSTLAAALGAGVPGSGTFALFGMRSTESSDRCAYELKDLAGRSWLVLDEGCEQGAHKTLESLTAVGRPGVLIYLTDPTQFGTPSVMQDRPGFPRETVSGFETLRAVAPQWPHCLVVTKCDRLVDAESITGSRQEARQILNGVGARQIVQMIDRSPALPVSSVGGLHEGTEGIPREMLTSVASMIRSRRFLGGA